MLTWQVHGNICAAAVVVTPTLDWKLHAFDVLSEFDGGNADAQGPMLVSGSPASSNFMAETTAQRVCGDLDTCITHVECLKLVTGICIDMSTIDIITILQPYEWMVGNQYKPMEVSKGDWTAVRRGPPHAIDAWGLGE